MIIPMRGLTENGQIFHFYNMDQRVASLVLVLVIGIQGSKAAVTPTDILDNTSSDEGDLIDAMNEESRQKQALA